MKLFKNKKNKALVAAVTASLVMGVCGNALAAKDYYGRGFIWVTDRNQAETSCSYPVWTSTSGDDNGEAGTIWGGISTSTIRACNNSVTVEGGNVQNVIGSESYSDTSGNKVIVKGGNVQNVIGGNVYVIGGYGSRSSYNNRVTVEGGNVHNVIGGQVDDGKGNEAKNNIVNINKNVTITGNVIGGKAGSRANALDNTINLNGRNVIHGDVIAGDGDGAVYGNTVNVYGDENTVNGTVCGLKRSTASGGNSLNIYGTGSFNRVANFQNVNIYSNGTSFGSVANLQDINIFVNPEKSYNDAKLKVNNALNFGQFRGINIIVNTLNPIDPQNKIVLLESPNSDFTKANKEKLKIKYQDISANDIEIDKKNMSAVKDIDAISAVIGFDISKTSIKLSTKYKLVADLKVDNTLWLDDRGLELNNKTLNMQDDKDTTAWNAEYSALRVNELTGTGFLNIDVDLRDNQNDRIEIVNEHADNNATININSIIVRSDLPGDLTGTKEQKGTVSVVEGRGDLNGITLNLGNNSIKTATNNYLKTATSSYVYTFTPGDKVGTLNYTKSLPGTLADFIQGDRKYTDVNYCNQTLDEVVDRSLGTTYRERDNKDISWYFKKGVTVSGDEKDGFTVDKGYNFTLKGEDGSAPGKLTQFKDAAATVRVGGILKVSNMKFEGNEKDIVNNGALKLTDTNTVHDISNAGTADIGGTNTITQISNTGTVNIDGNNTITQISNDGTADIGGTNTIDILSNTGTVNIDGNNTITQISNDGTADIGGTNTITQISNTGTAAFSGTNTIKDLSNAGTVNIDGNNIITQISNTGTAAFSGTNTINDLSNANTVKLNGSNTIGELTGIGTTIVEGGKTTVNNGFEQTAVTVNSGAGLELKNKAAITDTLTNAGTVTTSNSTINTLANTGTVNATSLQCSALVNNGNVNVHGNGSFFTKVSGQGLMYVYGLGTEVKEGFEQKSIEVQEASLNLKGDATIENATVSVNGLLEANNINISNTLRNDGQVNIKGNATLTKVVAPLPNNARFNVDAENKTVTVAGHFDQEEVNVTAGKLVLNGESSVSRLINIASKGALELGYSLDFYNGLKNDGTVTMKVSEKNALIGSVTGEGTFNVEAGQTVVLGAFAQKTVNVSGGELKLIAPEKSFLAGEVQGHAANITGGQVTGHIYGGASVDNAHDNTVNISGGTVTKDVYGGVTYNNGTAYKNTVNISGGSIEGDVYGGYTITNGTAYENTINISGGTIKGNVYGGINEYGKNSFHHDNVINISGGTVEGVIFGASDKDDANNLLHISAPKSESIKVGNIAYLQNLEFELPQGYKNENALLTLTKNQNTSLNLSGEGSILLTSDPEERLAKGATVTLIQKNNQSSLKIKNKGEDIFESEAYKNTALYIAGPMYIFKGQLELTSIDGDKSLDGKDLKNDLIFKVGNHILDDDEPEPKPEPEPTPKPEPEPEPEPKPEPEPEPEHKPDPDPIVPVVPVDPEKPDEPVKPEPIRPIDPEKPDEPDKPEVKPVEPEPQPTPEPDPQPQPIDYDKVYSELMDNVKTAMETRANGAALLNEAGDFLMKQGLSNAKMAAEANKAEGESSMAPFVALGGGKLRYETGSHVDSKSWHGAVGLAKQVNGLTFGVAIQQGKSNYDAYVNKAHSEGTSKSVGGALFAEKKIANGLHFDAAVRAGRVKNDYNANVTYSFEGAEIYNVRFKESAAFYGISFGGGKEFNLKNKDKVDVYGRYAWTHTGSSEATTNWKDELKFDGINSHHILLGSRYTHAVNERNELYAGFGWQYELGGKVKGSVYGYSAPEPSLKGSSGLLELGWKAAAEENMTVDLNLSGWTGKQRGVMAGVNMQWKF